MVESQSNQSRILIVTTVLPTIQAAGQVGLRWSLRMRRTVPHFRQSSCDRHESDETDVRSRRQLDAASRSRGHRVARRLASQLTKIIIQLSGSAILCHSVLYVSAIDRNV